MTSQLNISVTDIVAKLTQVNKEGGNMLETIYQDDVWNLQIALTNGNSNRGVLSFKALFIYKNGKTGENIIQMNGLNTNAPGTVAGQSNPDIHIRKDLLEKMESIAKGFYSQQHEIRSTPKAKVMMFASIIRNIDRLGGEAPTPETGKRLLEQDIQNGIVTKDTCYADSPRFVVEGRIKGNYFAIMQEILNEMNRQNTMVSAHIKNNIVNDLIACSLDPNKSIIAIINRMRPFIDQYMRNSGKTDHGRYTGMFNKTYGYVIYNKSNKQIPYDKIDYVTGKVIGKGIMQPADSTPLSNAEAARLLAGPTINCLISNGYVVPSSKKASNKQDWMNHMLIKENDDSIKNGGNLRSKDISQIKSDQWFRFMDTEKTVDLLDTLMRKIFSDRDGAEYMAAAAICADRIGKNNNMDMTKALQSGFEEIFNNSLKKQGINANASVTIQRGTGNSMIVNVSAKPSQDKKKGFMSMFKR